MEFSRVKTEEIKTILFKAEKNKNSIEQLSGP